MRFPWPTLLFDLWVEPWCQQRGHGEVIVVRFADDLLLGLQHESDARRFRIARDERLSKFGLALNSAKTRLVRFGRFASQSAGQAGEKGAGTFEFLGFPHMCVKTRRGRFRILRRTSKARMRVTLKAIRAQLKRNRHRPIPEQGAWLHRVLQGYFQYYAVRTNTPRLDAFRKKVSRAWLRALRQRSQRHRITWLRMRALSDRWLPPVRLLHHNPERRFFDRTQGRSPVR